MMSWTRPPKLFRYIYPHSKWECWLEQDILFTFDDGPGPHTDELLNLSQGYNIKFAFFILPQQAQKYPEIISRIVEEGHILGSHFLKHRNHILDTKAIFSHSLNESIQKIESISQNTIQYCRIPYGRLLPWQEKWINDCNCQHVFWSLDSKDYLHESADSIIHRIRSKMQANDIVLFHDGENSHPEIVKIVEECLKLVNFKK